MSSKLAIKQCDHNKYTKQRKETFVKNGRAFYDRAFSDRPAHKSGSEAARCCDRKKGRPWASPHNTFGQNGPIEARIGLAIVLDVEFQRTLAIACG